MRSRNFIPAIHHQVDLLAATSQAHLTNRFVFFFLIFFCLVKKHRNDTSSIFRASYNKISFCKKINQQQQLLFIIFNLKLNSELLLWLFLLLNFYAALEYHLIRAFFIFRSALGLCVYIFVVKLFYNNITFSFVQFYAKIKSTSRQKSQRIFVDSRTLKKKILSLNLIDSIAFLFIHSNIIRLKFTKQHSKMLLH